MADWYSRPMLLVADVDAASKFYVGKLGFSEAWRFAEADGQAFVAQVQRAGCEIILSSQWPDKVGMGMLFISLTAVDWKAMPRALAAGGVVCTEGWWGYRTWVVDDPDGNQLFFPDPDDPGEG
ncbi:glyoxalase/bleomycin resistance/extradiol dioxygenase family protein [Brevundimonas sp.]|uniref:VOC family protein n=1 Tax=Brevundimonas sp. TaxID=1871086 RepID=UPI002737E238|nr:glyoxalase superfamily protein [Brevundimonas sp.]MDP3801382.1 glyoxalase superfamily protein [Brevundimonas sp.]MDZ4361935.1 glyoxalase superfamily protein [Brevundimonas sp.]